MWECIKRYVLAAWDAVVAWYQDWPTLYVAYLDGRYYDLEGNRVYFEDDDDLWDDVENLD